LQQYFAPHGAIKRVEFTNNVDKGNRMLLDQSTFRGRVVAVRDKRTTVPGFNSSF
jgi:hypothetical protein